MTTTAIQARKIRLDEITSAINVRSIKEFGVTALEGKLKRLGFLPNFPILVATSATGGYRLLDGGHRVEAARRVGLSELPCHVVDGLPELDQLRMARQSNEAAETIVPTTFVDDAELVWRELAGGHKQQSLADALGWSRGAVSNYAALQKIDRAAWVAVATTFQVECGKLETPSVAENATPVAGPFTEGLLRSILDITPAQQLSLVTDLAAGKITKGKFKSTAEAYAARNELAAYATELLGTTDQELLDECLAEIDSGAYDDDWRKNGKDGQKVWKLIQSFRDKWERKHSVRLIHGDFYEKVLEVGAESVDCVISDLPYNISEDGGDIALAGDQRVRDFGEWDKRDHHDFISDLNRIAQQCARVMKPGASGYLFISDRYLSHLRDAVMAAGLNVRATLAWCKTNPPPQIRQVTYVSGFELILFFTKESTDPKVTHTFNWQGQTDMYNWFNAPLCGGNERMVDDKKQTLHPTQKPEAVIWRLMEVSTNRGDVVFDGFMGVGTVPFVAKCYGRKCIGIEIDQKYFEAAARRLS